MDLENIICIIAIIIVVITLIFTINYKHNLIYECVDTFGNTVYCVYAEQRRRWNVWLDRRWYKNSNNTI